MKSIVISELTDAVSTFLVITKSLSNSSYWVKAVNELNGISDYKVSLLLDVYPVNNIYPEYVYLYNRLAD